MDTFLSLKGITLIAVLCGFSNFAYSVDKNRDHSFFQDCFEAYPYSQVDEETFRNDNGEKIFLLAKNDHLINLALMDNDDIQNNFQSNDEDC